MFLICPVLKSCMTLYSMYQIIWSIFMSSCSLAKTHVFCIVCLFFLRKTSVFWKSLVGMPVRWSPFRKGIKGDLLVSRDVYESSTLYTRYENITVSNGRRICTLFTICEPLSVNPFCLVPKTELIFIFIL